MSLKLILGSSSKYRKTLLKDFGVGPFETMNPDIDEKAIRDVDAAKMVVMISSGKMDALVDKVKEDAVIITSDQVIEVDGQIREKPESVEKCKEFLRSYSSGKPGLRDAFQITRVTLVSRTAICHVGVVVYNTKTKQRLSGHAVAKQFFNPMPESFFDELIARGDCMWCAGGFCVEQMTEYAAHREGEIESVQGLPRALTLKLLHDVGFEAPQ